MKTIRFFISGSVQGIGYRQWLKHQAEKVRITGWVKNRTDGSVEAVVSGDDQNVDALIRRARKGPPLTHVVDITIAPYTRKETFSSFSVLQ
jgi:acylphosphatase